MQTTDQYWAEIWGQVRDKLRLDLGQGIFDSWIAPLSLQGVTDGHVRLSAPSRLICDYASSHHAARIERALATAPGFASLEILIATPEARRPNYSKAIVMREPLRPPHAISGTADGKAGATQGLWELQPDPEKSFASFIVGSANEFAFKAAQRFAESNDADIGMLFLHGGFGFGKTHLLNAIALEARTRRGARVLFLRAEDFMRRFLVALRAQETLAFKDELRGADILLIDDLQHICGRVTINEFLHTVNAFTDLKRKVVIAADRPPATLDGLDRKSTRLNSSHVSESRMPSSA